MPPDDTLHELCMRCAVNWVDEHRLPFFSVYFRIVFLSVCCAGCEPGSVGAMSTGSSPLDPLFWTLHGLFEKVGPLNRRPTSLNGAGSPVLSI